MKVFRSLQGLPLAIALTALTYLAFSPALGNSDATARVRTEVQLGDPTDTDPAPAPGPAKTARVLSVQSDPNATVYLNNSTHRAKGSSGSLNWWALAMLLSGRI